jgi:hypothetical protein
MEEKRKAERLKMENEVTINMVSGGENLTKEKIIYNCSKDICLYGAKIQSNILLPVDTIIKIYVTLNNLEEKITTIGKVKWNKVIIENGSYEAGVEFVDAPDETIQKLYELERIHKYDTTIPEEEWSNLQELNKYELSSEDNTVIPEEEWSNLQELNKYEIPPEDDTFIPAGEWSKLQDINKKEEVFIAKQIKKTIETVKADMKNCRYCSREIRSDAVKCEYCGRTLSGELTNRKVFI